MAKTKAAKVVSDENVAAHIQKRMDASRGKTILKSAKEYAKAS